MEIYTLDTQHGKLGLREPLVYHCDLRDKIPLVLCIVNLLGWNVHPKQIITTECFTPIRVRHLAAAGCFIWTDPFNLL